METIRVFLGVGAEIAVLVALFVFIRGNKKKRAEQAKALSITQGIGRVQIRVFRCPSCSETINTSVQQCPFCSSPIDTRTAEASADVMTKVSLACSEASELGSMASDAPTGREILWWGLIGAIVFRAYWIALAVPVSATRWWMKFGAIQTDDPDFVRAKRRVKGFAVSAAIIWGIILLVLLGLVVFAR